jgi:hypothetical protein
MRAITWPRVCVFIADHDFLAVCHQRWSRDLHQQVFNLKSTPAACLSLLRVGREVLHTLKSQFLAIAGEPQTKTGEK